MLLQVVCKMQQASVAFEVDESTTDTAQKNEVFH